MDERRAADGDTRRYERRSILEQRTTVAATAVEQKKVGAEEGAADGDGDEEDRSLRRTQSASILRGRHMALAGTYPESEPRVRTPERGGSASPPLRSRRGSFRKLTPEERRARADEEGEEDEMAEEGAESADDGQEAEGEEVREVDEAAGGDAFQI